MLLPHMLLPEPDCGQISHGSQHGMYSQKQRGDQMYEQKWRTYSGGG